MRHTRIASIFIGTVVLFSVFLLGTVVGWTVANSNQEVEEPGRPIGEFRRDVRAFVQRSKTKDTDEKAAAILDLCLLHREIVSDSRFPVDDNMVSFRAVVGNRLKVCKREVEVADIREKRALKKAASEARRNRKTDDDEDDTLLFDEAFEKRDEVALANAMATHMHIGGKLSGGPTQVFAYTNGNFGPGNAQELISLIETTIAPDTWEVNGGNGRMFFYQPVCALVVSASAEVQDRIGDLLHTIRRNGR